MADLAQCSVHGDPRDDASGAVLPLAFTHARHACLVYVLPAGKHFSCPLDSPLPRLVSLELQRPGQAFLYVHEGHRAGGSAYRVSALYVYDAVVRGVPTHPAFERLLHAYFAIFKSHSSSGCGALLLRPLGGDAANAGLLVVLNPTAI